MLDSSNHTFHSFRLQLQLALMVSVKLVADGRPSRKPAIWRGITNLRY